MPATAFLPSSAPLASFGRSILSLRREQPQCTTDSPTSVDGSPVTGGVTSGELDAFNNHAAEIFADLAADSDLLSLSWIRQLLDSFLIVFEEFRSVIFNADLTALDRLLSDFFERGVRALDVCNAVRDAAEHLRRWRRHLDIVFAAADPNLPLSEGQLRRARKALADLSVAMLPEADSPATAPQRHRSFSARRKDHRRSTSAGGDGGGNHLRSHSWSVSRSWSAARQLQAISSNLNPPKNNEIAATQGLAVPIYAMGSVLLFVMFALVAAFPCQDRGLQTHFAIPRSFPWAAPILSLHEKIIEESKKKERKNSNGLLKEIYEMEKSIRCLIELIDNMQYPIAAEEELEIREAVRRLGDVSDALKDGLDPMERQVREVFHRIARSRTEVFDLLNKSAS